MPKKNPQARTWVEIDKKAIAQNHRKLSALLDDGTRFAAVVKSNAYGHDMVPFAKELSKLGADWFAVDDIDEALALRKAGIKEPILVLGLTMPSRFTDAANADVSITISNFHLLKELARAGPKKPLKVHIKVDTGLNRQGFLPADMPKLIKELVKLSENDLRIEGLYSHLAAAESPETESYTARQLAKLKEWREAFRERDLLPLCHLGATAAGMVVPDSRLDMVRFGLGLYGVWPSAKIKKRASARCELAPVLTWKCVVGDVKEIPVGSLVGYDCSEAVRRASRIAVLPVGYWHGYPRHLSSKGHVLINGTRCKILGRVSMDMIVADATDAAKVRTGDTAVLIGKQKSEEITAEELSADAGTINYELLTRINPIIPRIYV